MKRLIISATSAFLLGFCLCGCSKDEAGKGSESTPEGDETVVTVHFVDGSRASRASGSYKAEERERTISNDIKLLVFREDGNLELEHDATLVDGKTQFKIRSGYKYFHVMANQPSVVSKPMLKDFEMQEQTVTFGANNQSPNIAVDNQFYINTLWGQSVKVAAGGTADDPIKITLDIGRIVSKLKLFEVVQTPASKMKGVFSDPFYRLGSIPRKYYQVGQFRGNIAPPASGYGVVMSAVHNEPWGTESGGIKTQNPIFTNYVPWTQVTGLPAQEGDPMQNYYYCIENTTAPDQFNDQYYGNTTYVQIQTKYTPDPLTELKSTVDPTQPGTPNANGDFWTAWKDDIRLILDKVPDPAQTPGMTWMPDEGKPVYEYAEGKNYHKFPVRDYDQSEPEKLNSVLRNQYYEINVTEINNLGDPTDVVDPSEPIPSDTEVEVTIKVYDWTKVSQGEEL